MHAMRARDGAARDAGHPLIVAAVTAGPSGTASVVARRPGLVIPPVTTAPPP